MNLFINVAIVTTSSKHYNSQIDHELTSYGASVHDKCCPLPRRDMDTTYSPSPGLRVKQSLGGDLE